MHRLPAEVRGDLHGRLVFSLRQRTPPLQGPIDYPKPEIHQEKRPLNPFEPNGFRTSSRSTLVYQECEPALPEGLEAGVQVHAAQNSLDPLGLQGQSQNCAEHQAHLGVNRNRLRALNRAGVNVDPDLGSIV